jgi:hypothetical protein
MLSSVKRAAVLAALAVVATFAAPPEAKALLRARITNGVTVVNIEDTSIVPPHVGMNDFNPTVRNLFFAGDVGAFSDGLGAGVNFIGSSNAPGDANPAIGSFVTNTTITVRNSSAGASTLTVEIWDDAFTIPSSSPVSVTTGVSSTQLTGTAPTATNTSAILTSPFGFGDVPSGFGPTASITGPVGPSDPALADTKFWMSGLPGIPYTIYQIGTITLGARQRGTVTFTTTITGVPEPAGMAMIASAAIPLLGFGLRMRRRAKA